VPEDVGVVEALGHQPAHDVALGELGGIRISRFGLGRSSPFYVAVI
jgi:hypothetical protein